MALEKSKLLTSGISGNYWKITKESYDRLTGFYTWTIELFKDKAASDAGKAPLNCSKEFKFSVDESDLDGDNTALGYVKIKERVALLVDRDIAGRPIDPPTALDPDLAGSSDV